MRKCKWVNGVSFDVVMLETHFVENCAVNVPILTLCKRCVNTINAYISIILQHMEVVIN